MLRVIWGIVVSVALTGTAALAHHGFSGAYNRAAPLYLEGTVERAYFGYPHAELMLQVDPAATSPQLPESAAEFAEGLTFWQPELGATVEIEFPPVSRFFALGERMTVGDRVAVIVLRNCGQSGQLRGQWIAPPAGPPVVREGRMQTEVQGC